MFVIAPSVNILRISTVVYTVAFVNLILKKMMMMMNRSWSTMSIARGLIKLVEKLINVWYIARFFIPHLHLIRAIPTSSAT